MKGTRRRHSKEDMLGRDEKEENEEEEETKGAEGAEREGGGGERSVGTSPT